MPPKIVIKRDICGKCAKTVYPEEAIDGAGKKWHKGLCFRCHHPAGCTITLDLKNHFAFEGKVYCNTHCPRPKATTIADDVMTQHARNAPKKASEGLGTAHKGAPGTERKGAPGTTSAAPTATRVAEPAAEPVAEPTPEAAPEPTPEPVAEEPAPEHHQHTDSEPLPVEHEAPAEHVEHVEPPAEHVEVPAEEQAPAPEEVPQE